MTATTSPAARKDLLDRVARLQDSENFSEALALLDTAEPHILITTRRGVVLRQMHRYAESISVLQAGVADHPADLGLLRELALSLRVFGDHAQSLQVSQALLDLNPAYKPALMARVETCMNQQDYDRAMAFLDEAESLLPADTTILARRASLLRQMNRLPESITLLQNRLAECPEDLALLHELSVSLRLFGDFDQSLSINTRVLTLNPEHRIAAMARIETLLGMQDFDTALACLAKARTQWPNHVPFAVKRAVILRQMRRTDESIAILRDLAMAHPNDPSVLLELSVSQRTRGDFGASLATIDQLLERHPAHRPGRTARIDLLAQLQDSDALLAIVASNGAQGANSTVDPAGQLRAAVRVLKVQPRLLAMRADLWTLISQQTDQLSVEQLHVVNRALTLWDQAPKGAAIDILRQMLNRGSLPAQICEDLIASCYAKQPADFADLAEGITSRAAPGDRGALRLFARSFKEDADMVLARRKHHLLQPRRVRDGLFIMRLLRQAGRVRMAERYVRHIARFWTEAPELVAVHIQCRLDVGDVASVEDWLKTALPKFGTLDPPVQSALMNALIHLDRLEDAEQVFEDHRSTVIFPPALIAQCSRVKQSLGKSDEALALLAQSRQGSSNQSMVHVAPSLADTLLTETMIETAQPNVTDIGRLTGAVTGIIRRAVRWTTALAPEAPIRPEPIIHQYWNTPQLPPDIQKIMASWQGHDGFTHRLYHRADAMKLLRERLGPDYARAFRNAKSPAEESDFFRLCILVLEGGLYVDCDDRLTGRIGDLIDLCDGFTVFSEPYGFLGNNLIAAPKGHPVTKRAAVSAKLALESRANESTWFKTGPGLLSRTVASVLSQSASDAMAARVTIHARPTLARHVQPHVPLPYKRAGTYWNAPGASHAVTSVIQALRDHFGLPEPKPRPMPAVAPEEGKVRERPLMRRLARAALNGSLAQE